MRRSSSRTRRTPIQCRAAAGFHDDPAPRGEDVPIPHVRYLVHGCPAHPHAREHQHLRGGGGRHWQDRAGLRRSARLHQRAGQPGEHRRVPAEAGGGEGQEGGQVAALHRAGHRRRRAVVRRSSRTPSSARSSVARSMPAPARCSSATRPASSRSASPPAEARIKSRSPRLHHPPPPRRRTVQRAEPCDLAFGDDA